MAIGYAIARWRREHLRAPFTKDTYLNRIEECATHTPITYRFVEKVTKLIDPCSECDILQQFARILDLHGKHLDSVFRLLYRGISRMRKDYARSICFARLFFSIKAHGLFQWRTARPLYSFSLQTSIAWPVEDAPFFLEAARCLRVCVDLDIIAGCLFPLREYDPPPFQSSDLTPFVISMLDGWKSMRIYQCYQSRCSSKLLSTLTVAFMCNEWDTPNHRRAARYLLSRFKFDIYAYDQTGMNCDTSPIFSILINCPVRFIVIGSSAKARFEQEMGKWIKPNQLKLTKAWTNLLRRMLPTFCTNGPILHNTILYLMDPPTHVNDLIVLPDLGIF